MSAGCVQTVGVLLPAGLVNFILIQSKINVLKILLADLFVRVINGIKITFYGAPIKHNIFLIIVLRQR